jgi:hypothetical protein
MNDSGFIDRVEQMLLVFVFAYAEKQAEIPF